MLSTHEYVITLDIDWAPDWVIEYVAQILIVRNVKATWFVTHQSEAIEKLRERSDLFELGIHPNLLVGSTHGQSYEEVLTHVSELVPNATSMRTHGLAQSSVFLVKAASDYGIVADLSLFLPRATHLVPHQIRWHGLGLWRFPYFWEDDSEMFEETPIWSLADERLNVPGLRIFDFHPIHVLLNTRRVEDYVALKQIRPLPGWDLEFVRKHVNKERGPANIFRELADNLSGGGLTVQDLVDITENRNESRHHRTHPNSL